MATRVLLTVDTELTDRYIAQGGWEQNLARSFDPAGVGVTWQLAKLAEHGLKGCFFVDPMPAVRYGLEPIRRMVEPILAAGQEVQLHLHPFWRADPATCLEPELYDLCRYSAEEQRDLIREARDLLVAAGAPPPVAFRAGSYAANVGTLEALDALGFRFDSSHNGGHHPDPSDLPFDPAQIGPAAWRNVVEVPVTQIARARGGVRHLQLCAVSSAEIEAALRHAAAHRHPLVTMVSHSFEFATRDGLRANAVYRGRFERLCRLLADHRTTLPTAHFVDLGDLVTAAFPEPLPPDPVREARRMVEQAWADSRYEYPGRVAGVLSGSAAAAAGMSLWALAAET